MVHYILLNVRDRYVLGQKKIKDWTKRKARDATFVQLQIVRHCTLYRCMDSDCIAIAKANFKSLSKSRKTIVLYIYLLSVPIDWRE